MVRASIRDTIYAATQFIIIQTYNIKRKSSILHTNVAAFIADCQADHRPLRLSLTELFSLACLDPLDHTWRSVMRMIVHKDLAYFIAWFAI